MASFQADLEELSDYTYPWGLLNKFEQFREEESFCDYVIKVENKEFKVCFMNINVNRILYLEKCVVVIT